MSYAPENRLFLERRSQIEEGTVFEIALCRECGQHYLVGKFREGKLQQAIRDPGRPDFRATFFRPIEETFNANDEEGDSEVKKKIFRLGIECGEMVQVGRKQSKPVT